MAALRLKVRPHGTRCHPILAVPLWVGEFLLPHHLAAEHWAWLAASVHFTLAADTPFFPTMDGKHANKVQVVDTFEALGATMGQPLHDHVGARRFGGHTPRATGSRVLAAGGMEVNKARIMARHSGDTILRYVADAPLKSLRADLGLSSIPALKRRACTSWRATNTSCPRSCVRESRNSRMR